MLHQGGTPIMQNTLNFTCSRKYTLARNNYNPDSQNCAEIIIFKIFFLDELIIFIKRLNVTIQY